ncbi:MAG: c-type cytochrome, partial [Acidimicrobiia bacterium]
LYEEQCVACHGAAGVGGAAPYTVLDENGRFISSVNWTAPALNTVMYRFSEDEVLHILNFGRPQSPMPAWGTPGGGPLTSQQVEELIAYLERIQIEPEQMASEVNGGLRNAVFEDVRSANPEPFDTLAAVSADSASTAKDVAAAADAVDSALDAFIGDLAANDPEGYGELLFNNSAGAGAYGCARCHTGGASWNADDALAANPALEGLVHAEEPGSGAFGPGLVGVASQFTSAESQVNFVSRGCEPNLQYGNNGVCEPSGQMPGFGPDATDLAKENGGGMLTRDQVAAIVAYERSLQ